MQKKLFNAAQASKWGSTWIERNQHSEPDLQARAPELWLELDKCSLALNSAARNISNRPTIAVFGPSQAGKSYLISKMAAGDETSLQARWDDLDIDFIRHVNPSGNDSEATGFATRFTHKRNQAPENFPVELKVLNEMDVAKILVNAFFEEIKQDSVVFTQDEAFYLNHLASLSSYVDRNAKEQFLAYPKERLGSLGENDSNNPLDFANDTQAEFTQGRKIVVGKTIEYNYIQPEDVTSFAYYVASNSKGKLGAFSTMPKFWLELRNTLPFMTLEGRIKAISILWKDLAVFNILYQTLASQLLVFEGRSKIFAAKEAFITVSGSNDNKVIAQRTGGTLLHISKLKDMFFDEAKISCALVNDSFNFQGTYEVIKTVEVELGKLAALSMELCWVLDNQGSLDEFDILDLPGARSRKQSIFNEVAKRGVGFNLNTKTLQSASIDEIEPSDFFRRGKVAYLFERYSLNNEIDQLVFCLGLGKQQEVPVAFQVLTDWINHNIGETPSARAKVHSPLTLVLTRYDEVFCRAMKTHAKNQPVDIATEINVSFEHLIYDWFREWTPGKPFDRIYLARKPNVGAEYITWIDYGENNIELGIKSDKIDIINNTKEELCKVEVFQSHIPNFEQALDDVLTLNDGGVDKIVQAIKANALPDDKRISFHRNKPSSYLQKVNSLINPFAKRDMAIARGKAVIASKELAYGLLQCNSLSRCFDLLRSLLELPQDNLVDIYSQNFTAGSNAQRFVQFVCMEYQDNLATLWRKDNVYLSNIADNIVSAYKRLLPALQVDPRGKDFYPLCYNQVENRFKQPDELKGDIITLFNNLYLEVGKAFNSSKIDLKSYMVQVLLDQENTSEGFKDSVKSQVQLLSFILSDFNLYLGTNLLPLAKEQPSAKVNEQSKARAVQAPQAPQVTASPYSSDFDDYDDNEYALVGSSSNNQASSKVVDIPNSNITPSEVAMQRANKGGVLGTIEGPVNNFVKEDLYIKFDSNKQDHQVFARHYEVDSTQLLPHLNELSRDYEFNLVSDFASTLIYTMCNVNLLTESKYQFSQDENLLLCRILSTMECID